MNHKVYMDENPLDIIDESLFESHSDEVGVYDRVMNRKLYDSLSCILFYDKGKQFAYYVFAVQPHQHYDKIVFQDVCYFVKKEFRLKYSREVFDIVEKIARELDCDLIINHCKRTSQVNFFKKRDFVLIDYTVVKELL